MFDDNAGAKYWVFNKIKSDLANVSMKGGKEILSAFLQLVKRFDLKKNHFGLLLHIRNNIWRPSAESNSKLSLKYHINRTVCAYHVA